MLTKVKGTFIWVYPIDVLRSIQQRGSWPSNTPTPMSLGSTVSATPSVTRSPMSERPSPHSTLTRLTKSLLIEPSPLFIERRRQHSKVLEWCLHEQLNQTERCLFWILANVPQMLETFLVALRDWIWWTLSLWWDVSESRSSKWCSNKKMVWIYIFQ